MKARGEKRHTIVDAVLAERSTHLALIVPYCVEMGQKRYKSEEITAGWRSD